jgi:hypothetical protein
MVSFKKEYLYDRTMIIARKMCSTKVESLKGFSFHLYFKYIYTKMIEPTFLFFLPSSHWINGSHQPWTSKELSTYNRKKESKRKAWHSDVKKLLLLLLNIARPFTTISNSKGGLSTKNTMRWIIASY